MQNPNTGFGDTHVYTLFSGSSGNSVYIRSGTSEILIDAGMSARRINAALAELDSSLARIDAVFVTHEHIDHSRGIETISKHYPAKIHITEGSAPYIRCAEGRAIIHTPVFSCRVGEVEISSFTTSHDSNMSVGFTLAAPDIKVGLATDLGYMTVSIINKLAECDAVILEANHDVGMLERGPYPYSLKKRILSKRGHLSNFDCARCAVYLAEHGVKKILLAHLSDINNTPKAALDEVQNALEQCGFDRNIAAVASRYSPTALI